jgi:hypothetical protein
LLVEEALLLLAIDIVLLRLLRLLESLLISNALLALLLAGYLFRYNLSVLFLTPLRIVVVPNAYKLRNPSY